MTEHIKSFESHIHNVVANARVHIEAAKICDDMDSYVETLSKVIPLAERVISFANEYELKINYLNQFQNTFQQILVALPYNGQTSTQFITEHDKSQIKTNISVHEIQLNNLVSALDFDIEFFLKLGFFTDNVVAIGSNGSGKTSLSVKLKRHMENNGVVISAQKILLIPDIDTINNPQKTATELKESQSRDKTNKNPNEIRYLQNEFGVVLKNLLADNISLSNQYRNNALEADKNSSGIPSPPKSNLDRTLEIWNSLIEHRTLYCRDGMNLSLEYDSGQPYSAAEMSDGEKVLLFLIAQVLQAPTNGFVIADEPEMYLHKSVLKKLWDYLERERHDCIFIYLTHDLDFATSRTDAKKIWIKSFTPPSSWEIEDIPTNSIPEPLILELIGSRKNILFCEGDKGSLDDKIYSILFPHLTITPVGSCLDVINHTRAFNRIETVNIKAIGLIDSDHQPAERITPLAEDSVYSFSVAEVENILLDEDFLMNLSQKIFSEENAVELIKQDILNELMSEKEQQAANYVSSKVDYYFKDSNIKKGNSIDELNANLEHFNSCIDISSWYQGRISEIEGVLREADYARAISIFNNKGIKRFANSRFKISDFTEKAIRFLQQSEDNSYLINKHFPSVISEKNLK